MQPKLSVVVTTRNRVGSLARCVDALLSTQSVESWELIVVDNGSTDGSRDYLQSLASPKPNVAIKVASESRKGSANARNSGWRRAEADLVSFIDDDCYVDARYIDEVIATFADPEVGFFGGRVLLFDKNDLRLTIQECIEERRIEPRSFVLPGDILGANMGFRKSVLGLIGGFDRRTGSGGTFSGDDVNAIAAAVWAGIVGVYNPRILVFHHHGRKAADFWRKMDVYDHGVGAYYAKFLLKAESRRTYLRILRWQFANEYRFWGIRYVRVVLFRALGAAHYCVLALGGSLLSWL
jgi:glycosyltransferase involved in cell wall biosynthesis